MAIHFHKPNSYKINSGARRITINVERVSDRTGCRIPLGTISTWKAKDETHPWLAQTRQDEWTHCATLAKAKKWFESFA